ncbi:hypothetical protein EWB00_004224 [Schistosoma japonicum]|uniref:Uncharacterized protein n=1 Tax=Schistosoma japonicum TaxID=6182 RepID=A0A4Z2D723_SCHJA|nr:hypothetical protein EWB00_004224 [Schistosoma japonicum]
MHDSTSKSKEDCLNDKDNEQEVNIVKHDTLQPSHNNQQYNYHFSHSQPQSNLNYYSNHTLHSHQSFHHLHKHLPPPLIIIINIIIIIIQYGEQDSIHIVKHV